MVGPYASARVWNDPVPIDREGIPVGQARSALWGDEGYEIFHRTPQEDLMFQSARRSELMRRFYEQQQ